MSRKTREQYHHGDLRRALIEATEAMIRTDGLEKVSLRAIARRAGVSHAAPYHHFNDMEGLLAAVAASGFNRLREAMLGRATASNAAMSNLQQAGIAYVCFAAENPELYRLMFSGRLQRSVQGELVEAGDAAFAALGELLGRVTQKSLKGTAVEQTQAAQTAWATVHGLAMLIIDGRLDVDRNDREAVEQAAREVTRVLGRGLKELRIKD